MVQRVCILGATGSVGSSTLDVMALHPERYEAFALTAFHRIDALARLCRQWRPRFAVVGTTAQAAVLRDELARDDLPTEVLHGEAAL
ncbi:MAG: 1-deoxy-D-xylulose-5-phosphate reductoisomerase, partial [Microbacteriaceae bacterium]|nr:1-deoxy-D-xylulose-5-phosphate reductoisomerase [Burkholderiaceae bacterium]